MENVDLIALLRERGAKFVYLLTPRGESLANIDTLRVIGPAGVAMLEYASDYAGVRTWYLVPLAQVSIKFPEANSGA